MTETLKKQRERRRVGGDAAVKIYRARVQFWRDLEASTHHHPLHWHVSVLPEIQTFLTSKGVNAPAVVGNIERLGLNGPFKAKKREPERRRLALWQVFDVNGGLMCEYANQQQALDTQLVLNWLWAASYGADPYGAKP